MSKENTHISGLSGQMKATMEMGENGVVNQTGDVLDMALRDGATRESWALHEEIRAEIVAANSKALGELAIEHMAEDKTLDRVETTLDIGRDKVELGFARSAQYPNPKVKGEKISKMGVSSCTYKTYGSRNVADLKKIRTDLAEQAEKLLAE